MRGTASCLGIFLESISHFQSQGLGLDNTRTGNEGQATLIPKKNPPH